MPYCTLFHTVKMSQTPGNNKLIAKDIPYASNSGCALFTAESFYINIGVTDCGICNAVG